LQDRDMVNGRGKARVIEYVEKLRPELHPERLRNCRDGGILVGREIDIHQCIGPGSARFPGIAGPTVRRIGNTHRKKSPGALKISYNWRGLPAIGGVGSASGIP